MKLYRFELLFVDGTVITLTRIHSAFRCQSKGDHQSNEINFNTNIREGVKFLNLAE